LRSGNVLTTFRSAIPRRLSKSPTAGRYRRRLVRAPHRARWGAGLRSASRLCLPPHRGESGKFAHHHPRTFWPSFTAHHRPGSALATAARVTFTTPFANRTRGALEKYVGGDANICNRLCERDLFGLVGFIRRDGVSPCWNNTKTPATLLGLRAALDRGKQAARQGAA
jgi:hypothetical protein